MTLGYLYYNGQVVPQDVAEAFRWYRKAADGSSTNAWYMVGQTNYNGTGVKQDRVEAAKWLRKAANECNLEAQTFLGYLYSVGEGVIQSDERAAYCYQKAAERGDANAQANLGRALYRLGRFSEAHEWMKRAIGRLTGDAHKNAANDLKILAARLTPEELSRSSDVATD